MIHCKELNKDFNTKAELFQALKLNEKKIIRLKKAMVQKSHEKGQFSPIMTSLRLSDTQKSELNMNPDSIYAVINTTLLMDSHSDVHFNGIWDKTLKDNGGSFFYITDHDLSVSSVVAWPEDVKAYVKMLPWSAVGKDYDGETQALIFEIKKDKIVHEAALKAVNDNKKIQNSVRMRYIKIIFAVNSSEKGYEENKAYFEAHIDEIANKEEAMEQGYFWGVEEAQIHKEGSMVLFGSNDATPVMQLEDEPEDSTQTDNKNEPSDDTHKVNVMFNYL